MGEDIAVTPPLGDEQPDGVLTCGYGVDPHLCGEAATRHIIWTHSLENGLACDRHYAESQRRWAMYDSHPVMALCNMPSTTPEWSWDNPPGRCLWIVDDETHALVVAATREAVAS